MSDVRAFGAKGDGVADDAPAIQHAVEKASDGLLKFPLGNYRLSRTIDVQLAQHGRIALRGHGGTGQECNRPPPASKLQRVKRFRFEGIACSFLSLYRRRIGAC